MSTQSSPEKFVPSLGGEGREYFSATAFLFCLTSALVTGTAFLVSLWQVCTGVAQITNEIAFCGFYFWITFGITIGFHRHLTHGSFKWKGVVGRWIIRPIILIGGCIGWQSFPLWWSATHAKHHAHSDTHGDPHGPVEQLKQFFYVQFGVWVPFSHPDIDAFCRGKEDRIDWFVRFLSNRWGYLLCGPTLGVSLAWLLGGWTMVTWYLAAVFCAWHFTQSINSVTHLKSLGSRPYDTGDNSNNLWWLALLTGGEAFHNGHHAFQKAAVFAHRVANRTWERLLDTGGLLIRIFELCGIVTDVIRPSDEQVTRKLQATGQ